jgi:hypothetical protein
MTSPLSNICTRNGPHERTKMEQSSRAVVGPLERTVRRVAGAWRAWRRRRYWTAERQLENLRNMVQGDHRWLAHDKVADALTTRYLAALAPDWMSRAHACPDHFRREIGLEPPHTFKVAEPECTCAAKDMTFGRCCKVTPNA